MVQDISHIRAWVRQAKRVAGQTGKPLSQVLEEIGEAVLSGAQSCQIVSSTSEAGGSVSLTFPPGQSPLELASLNESAIAWCNSFPNPENPPLNGRRIQRLRVSFWKAHT